MKVKWFSFLTICLVTALVLSLSSTPLQADAILDFNLTSPTTGTISYAGGANPLVGSNISVDSVVGLGTSANDGVVRSLFSARLNFTTGNLIGFTSTTWDFSGGGSISLVGGVDLNNDGDTTDPGDIPNGTLLLVGAFDSAAVVKSGGSFRVAISAFTDTKNDALLAFYNLPSGPSAGDLSGNFNISFFASGSPPNRFGSRVVLSGDVTNTCVGDCVGGGGGGGIPEPASLTLVGCGFLTMGFLQRKLLKKK